MRKILVALCCWLVLISPLIGGAVYDFGDQHVFTWTVLDPTTAVPTTPSAITITVYRGSGTEVVAATAMTALSTGHYYYAYTVPSTAGDYWAKIDWTISAVNYAQVLGAIKVKDINETPPTASEFWANGTRTLTGFAFQVTLADGSLTAAKIAANAFVAASFAAGSLNGKGDWNIGKTGYSLTQAFPTNFADLSITASTGQVTVGTNADKTGYALSTAGVDAVVDGNWNELQAGHTTPNSFGAYLDAAISSVGGGAAPSAAEISDSVLSKAMAPFTIAGTFGKLMNDNLDAAVSTRSTFDVATETVDVGAIAGNPNTPDSMNLIFDGAGATLKLKQLSIVADGNKSAIVATGAGSGHGAHFTGGATGDGFRIAGGATSGNGLYTFATTSGQGFLARGGSSAGNGFQAEGLNNGNGIRALGHGTSGGLYAQGGLTGPGAYFRGGLTNGNGLTLWSDSGDGLNATGRKTGHGIRTEAADSGSAFYALGGDKGSAAQNPSGVFARSRIGDAVYLAAGTGDNRHAIEARGGTGAGGDAIRILGLGPSGVAVSATSEASTLYTTAMKDELRNWYWNMPFGFSFAAGSMGDSLNNPTFVQGDASGLGLSEVQTLMQAFHDSTLMMLTLYPGSKYYNVPNANMDTVYTVSPAGDTIAVQVYFRIGKPEGAAPDTVSAVAP